VDGVVPDDGETFSQLPDAVIVKGTAAPAERLMDWLAGFEPPAVATKVKLDGLGASIGLLETTSVTGTICGELEAVVLVIEIAA